MLYKESGFQVPQFEAAKGRQTYANPVIADFADPSVTFDHAGGWYYATRSYFGKEGAGLSPHGGLAPAQDADLCAGIQDKRPF